MNGQHLVYSTVFGGVAIYERQTGTGSGDRPTFDLPEQLDFSGNKNLLQYPLAIDRDFLVVGFGNEYWVSPEEKSNGWMDGAFYIKNGAAAVASVPSVAASGRNILAGSGSLQQELYHYNI